MKGKTGFYLLKISPLIIRVKMRKTDKEEFSGKKER